MIATSPKLQHDGALTIAIGSSRKEVQWRNREMLWSELVGRLSKTTRTSETQAEYRAMTRAKQGDIKDVGGFVGGTLSGGRRKAGAVAWRQLLTLDMDYVDGDPWGTITMLWDYAVVLYSTHSHTPAKPRLRLVIPLQRAVTADEYAALSRRVAADIGIDMFDDTTYEPHRLMYWPSTSQDGDYVYRVQDGPWLDVDATLAQYADWSDPAQWPQSSRKTDAIRKQAAKQGNPLDKPGLIGAFCRAYPISAAIEKYLPEVYLPHGDGRYTYAEGSCVGGLVLYDNDTFAYSHHGTDPCSGKLCNAWDLVRIHLYGARDEDAAEGTAPNRLPSYTAMTQLVRDDPTVRKDLAAARLAEAGQDFGADDDWLGLLEQDKRGNIESTRNNALIILEHDPYLKDAYMYDTFRLRPVVAGDLPWLPMAQRAGRDWTDDDDAALRVHMEHVYGLKGKDIILDAFVAAMMHRRVHPVRAYLDSLMWDGVARVDTLLVDYLGAEDTPYTRAVTRKALCGAVARILRPGCKHDHMLVLIGKQGTGKSTLVSRLGGKWFSDSLYTVQGKEAYEQLQGAWILEMSEMSAMRKAEVEATKAFISKQTDTFRAAYARRSQSHPRQCVFFGTTNDAEFLHDQTGGRRFWPVDIGRRERTRSVWGGLTEAEVGQIWAEAIELYRAGEALYLPAELETEARELQEKHTESNAKLGLIEEYLDRLLPADWDNMDLVRRRMWLQGDELAPAHEGTVQRTRVCAMEVWQELFGGDAKQLTPGVAREINNLLRRIPGWEPYQGSATGRLKFGRLYGLQRAFVRVSDEGIQ